MSSQNRELSGLLASVRESLHAAREELESWRQRAETAEAKWVGGEGEELEVGRLGRI